MATSPAINDFWRVPFASFGPENSRVPHALARSGHIPARRRLLLHRVHVHGAEDHGLFGDGRGSRRTGIDPVSDLRPLRGRGRRPVGSAADHDDLRPCQRANAAVSGGEHLRCWKASDLGFASDSVPALLNAGLLPAGQDSRDPGAGAGERGASGELRQRYDANAYASHRSEPLGRRAEPPVHAFAFLVLLVGGSAELCFILRVVGLHFTTAQRSCPIEGTSTKRIRSQTSRTESATSADGTISRCSRCW